MFVIYEGMFDVGRSVCSPWPRFHCRCRGSRTAESQKQASLRTPALRAGLKAGSVSTDTDSLLGAHRKASRSSVHQTAVVNVKRCGSFTQRHNYSNRVCEKVIRLGLITLPCSLILLPRKKNYRNKYFFLLCFLIVCFKV